jgi:hypothetical protein
VSWADDGPAVTAVVPCDPVICGPRVALTWPTPTSKNTIGFDEPVTWNLLTGGAIILVGVALSEGQPGKPLEQQTTGRRRY